SAGRHARRGLRRVAGGRRARGVALGDRGGGGGVRGAGQGVPASGHGPGAGRGSGEMKTALQTIRILSDGRPGHENQSVGLAEALRRRTGASVECVRWPAGAGLFKRIGLARAGGEGGVDLLIGAGHGTHLPLLAAARKFGARSVVIMKPSLPRGLFDLCVVPRHDLAVPADSGNVVVTRGALNRIPEDAAVKT